MSTTGPVGPAAAEAGAVGATVEAVTEDLRRILRVFGFVAAAWTALLALTAPAVDQPRVLWGGVAVVAVYALGSLAIDDGRVWWVGWLLVALGTELLGPLAGSGGWSVAGGATLLTLVAAALSPRARPVVVAVVLLSVTALSRGLVSPDWTVGGSVGAVFLFVFAGGALRWFSTVLVRTLGERDALREEVARAREVAAAGAARDEAAASLHDSVLQHLVVVGRAEDLASARRAATRASDDLRAFIRRPDPSSATVRRAVEDAARAAADGASLSLAGAGDAPLDEHGELLAAAVGEAVRNAVHHGRPPVAVHVEVRGGRATAWVSDTGPGFAPDEVDDDRLGVRNSIVARVERAGGRATLTTREDRCEWQLEVPLTEP